MLTSRLQPQPSSNAQEKPYPSSYVSISLHPECTKKQGLSHLSALPATMRCPAQRGSSPLDHSRSLWSRIGCLAQRRGHSPRKSSTPALPCSRTCFGLCTLGQAKCTPKGDPTMERSPGLSCSTSEWRLLQALRATSTLLSWREAPSAAYIAGHVSAKCSASSWPLHNLHADT